MIHVIIGTRAQIIKMAPVMKEFEKRGINYNFIFLAQHKETMHEIFGQKPNLVNLIIFLIFEVIKKLWWVAKQQ